MKNILDKKFVDFAKNTIVYSKVLLGYANNKYKSDDTGKYDYTCGQYEIRKRISKWFVELKYGSTSDDLIYKQLIELFKNSTLDDFQTKLKDIIKKFTIGDKEKGWLLHYAWYFAIGCPFSHCDDMAVYEKNMKKLGELIIPFVEDWKQNEKQLNAFEDLVLNTFQNLRKKQESEIEKVKLNKIKDAGISFKLIEDLIKKSTLHDDIKNEIFDNIKEKYQDLIEVCESGLIVHDDTLFDSIGEEKNWRTHFKKNLKNFPLNITTEHWTLLYKAGE